MKPDELELLSKIQKEFADQFNNPEFEQGKPFTVIIDGKEVCICRKSTRGFPGLVQKIRNYFRPVRTDATVISITIS